MHNLTALTRACACARYCVLLFAHACPSARAFVSSTSRARRRRDHTRDQLYVRTRASAARTGRPNVSAVDVRGEQQCTHAANRLRCRIYATVSRRCFCRVLSTTADAAASPLRPYKSSSSAAPTPWCPSVCSCY